MLESFQSTNNIDYVKPEMPGAVSLPGSDASHKQEVCPDERRLKDAKNRRMKYERSQIEIIDAKQN